MVRRIWRRGGQGVGTPEVKFKARGEGVYRGGLNIPQRLKNREWDAGYLAGE